MDTEVKDKMQKALEHFEAELSKIRTGRAHPSMLDSVVVEAYGQQMPLVQLASVVASDATLLVVTPFDPGNLPAITAAIRDNKSLGLNPADDGKLIRVPIPALTEERRKQMTKQIGEKAEQSRIALRNIRQDAMRAAKAEESSGNITKDDLKSTENQLNEMIADFQKQIEDLSKAKEKELLTV